MTGSFGEEKKNLLQARNRTRCQLGTLNYAPRDIGANRTSDRLRRYRRAVMDRPPYTPDLAPAGLMKK